MIQVSSVLAVALLFSAADQESSWMSAIMKPAARIGSSEVSYPDDGLIVRVPHRSTYAGGERFILYGNADAEIHVFVEADKRREVKRLYWIQREAYLPSWPDRRYNYADNHRAHLWGRVTWTGGGPRLIDGPDRPGSDLSHVLALLHKAGYVVPAEMMSARLVQLLDDPEGTGRGRRELMLIYSENLAPTGKRYSELVQNGRTTLAWDPLEAPLIARATDAFSVEIAR